MTGKISLAITINNYEIFLWEYRILEEIMNSEFAEIKLLIVKSENTTTLNNHNCSPFYKLHEKLDHFYYKKNFDYDRKRNILNLIEGIPIISFSPLKKETNKKIFDDVFIKIKDYYPDIILNFGHSKLNGDFLDVSRFGILSYHISDNRIIRGFSNGYWEVVKKFPEIGATLQIVSNDFDENTVIYRTGLITHPNSLNVNRNQIYGLASLIIPRILKGIYLYGSSFLERAVNKYNVDIEIFNNKFSRYPSSFDAFKNLLVVFTRAIFNNFRPVNKGRWFLIFLINKKKYPFQVELGTFKELIAPKDCYWADPFVISKHNSHYIFIEEFLEKTGKGHISVLKLDQEGKLLSSEKIIEKPYHMSYPFIFELNDKYFMIPETKGNRTIELYKCINFPNEWEFVMNLMDNVSATDSTLFFYDSKWWLFTSINETKNIAINFNELFLFYSEDLFSNNWKSHPDNPIITDIKSSRQAGRIFTYNHKIFRPSQDCSGRYGKAFNINQITKLSENEYEEILVSYVKPNWNKKLEGMHTFNFNNEIFVLDVFQKDK